MSYITLKELCDELSISQATGKNWIRTGKLSAQRIENNKPYFSRKYITKLKADLVTGEKLYLRSRRNKSFASGNSLYKMYLSKSSPNYENARELILRYDRELSNEEISCVLFYCAASLIFDRLNLCNDGFDFFSAERTYRYSNLVNDLLSDTGAEINFVRQDSYLGGLTFTYNEGEDLLGFIYMSLKSISERKQKGAYYTPGEVVDKLFDGLFDEQSHNAKILDPCCGTGNFLISLPDDISLHNIYGNDIDAVSVKLARINLALKFLPENTDVLYENITCSNFLLDYIKTDFDYIIGNPPWGAFLTDKEKEHYRKKYEASAGKSVETYDMFIEESLSHLRKNGELSFVLPEAILNVRTHKKIRELILKKTSIDALYMLGEDFYKVSCPSIILRLRYTDKELDTSGMIFGGKNGEHIIKTSRKVDSDCFSFGATDYEYSIIENAVNGKNCPVVFLKDNACFALGIVTGDNNKFISDKKGGYNERIIKGSNIKKYKICGEESYINLNRGEFQQQAPLDIYRAKEKLVYRFIGGELIFAYEASGALTLNSCNILIPQLEGLSIKYVLAILNSSISQFIFSKKFNSVKVLRSHIEQLPIPVVSKELQSRVVAYVDKIMSEQSRVKCKQIYDELDKLIANIFGLTDEEYSVVK